MTRPAHPPVGGLTVISGSTTAIMDAFGLCRFDEHTKAWRWHMYMQDNDKRMDAVRAEARKIIAARRAVEDAEFSQAAE